MSAKRTINDTEELAARILDFFEKKNIDVAVRRDRYGVSIIERTGGHPVARFKICGKDRVEVLWWKSTKWDKIGDFGGMRMSVSEAVKYVHEDPMRCFWPERRVKAVADALAVLLGLSPPDDKKTVIAPDTKLPVQLTLRERDLIRDKTFCDPDFARLAPVKNGLITVPMTLGDIEEVQGYVAAEANHTKDKKVEKELNRLFFKLQTYLDEYEEE